MTIQDEHDQLKWELSDQRRKVTDLTVENIEHLAFRARRLLMMKYFGLGKPEKVLPLFKHALDPTFDVWDITFLFKALVRHKKGEMAIALWTKHLNQVEKKYWSGLRVFRRRYKHKVGNPADLDPEGKRIHLYEMTRWWLNFGYQQFDICLSFVPHALSKGLEAEIKERLRCINSEALSE